MRRHHLIARHRLVAIVAREGERALQRRASGLGTHIEVHGHALPRAWPRAVEREVLPRVLGSAPGSRRVGFAVRLTHAEREETIAVLAIPHVPEIDFGFARPEERVRRRERGDRAAGGFDREHAIGGDQRHGRIVLRAAELIVLPEIRGVAPDDARRGLNRQALDARLVLVGDRRLVGLRNQLLPDQARAFVDRVLEPSRKHAGVDARKRDLDARAVGLHRAAPRLIRRRRAPDFFRLARQSRLVGDALERRRRIAVRGVASRDVQRRVPERIPLDSIDHVRRDRDAEIAQRSELLLRRAAQSRDDPELGRHVGGERDPVGAFAPHGQFPDCRRAAVVRQPQPQLLTVRAVPGQLEDVAAHRSSESRHRPVLGQAAVQRIGVQRRGGNEKSESRQQNLHRDPAVVGGCAVSHCGWTNAPLPAESHAANRTQTLPVASKGIENFLVPCGGRSVARIT